MKFKIWFTFWNIKHKIRSIWWLLNAKIILRKHSELNVKCLKISGGGKSYRSKIYVWNSMWLEFRMFTNK